MKSSTPTEKRILDAACVEFAEMGYSKAQIREIASNAGANLAAANYYYGGKAKLYMAVFNYLFEKIPLKQNETLEELLTRLLLECSNNTKLLRSKLLYREFREPTEMFTDVCAAFVKPRMEHLSRLVAEVSGYQADSEENRRLVLDIMARVMFHRMNQSLEDTFMKTESYAASNAASLARSIVDSLRLCAEFRETARHNA